MIKAEQQVTSLERSQAFRTLGVPQGGSYFIWVVPFNPEKISEVYIDYKNAYVLERKRAHEEVRRYPYLLELVCDAFTLTELFYLAGKLPIANRRPILCELISMIDNPVISKIPPPDYIVNKIAEQLLIEATRELLIKELKL